MRKKVELAFRRTLPKFKPSIESTAIRSVEEISMLKKRSERQARAGTAASPLAAKPSETNLDRRSFLRRSGLAAGSLAALGSLPLGCIQRAEAGPPPSAGATVTTRKNI